MGINSDIGSFISIGVCMLVPLFSYQNKKTMFRCTAEPSFYENKLDPDTDVRNSISGDPCLDLFSYGNTDEIIHRRCQFHFTHFYRHLYGMV